MESNVDKKEAIRKFKEQKPLVGAYACALHGEWPGLGWRLAESGRDEERLLVHAAER